MKRILILIALFYLSASQIAVGQEDGQLGFECSTESGNSVDFFQVNMVEERGRMFEEREQAWGSWLPMQVLRDEIRIYYGSLYNRHLFSLNRTTLKGTRSGSLIVWSCAMMNWDEVDQKAAAHLAELNKDRVF